MLLALWSWRQGEWALPYEQPIIQAKPKARRRIQRVELLPLPQELPQPYRQAKPDPDEAALFALRIIG